MFCNNINNYLLSPNNKNNKKTVTVQNNDNNIDIEKFYNSFPALLKSDSNGNLNLDRSAFISISNKNKYYKSENRMAIYKAKTKQISKIKGNMDLSAAFDIVIFHNDLNFKTEINEMINKSYEYESDTFITKILIGSISILREDIKLSQNFINKIKKTAEET